MLIELTDSGTEDIFTGEKLVQFQTEKMRSFRNLLLSECDWTQVADNQLNDVQRVEWRTYRQTLRDFPETWEPGPTVEFPDPPGAD